VVMTLLSLALPAAAQTDTAVEAFRDWSVFNPSDPRECYIVSPPVKTVARRGGETVSVQRGEIRLFVTIRPSEGVNKELSYTGGYPFRSGSTVDVSISGRTYTLNPGSGQSEEWAWPASPERDTELIQAMRSGSSAQITAISSRGTQTIDDFSLLGFTAALEKAEELCQ
ncbi:MAG: invasion associated locus B family protein, partial [Pseudomonadota bacterium]